MKINSENIPIWSTKKGRKIIGSIFFIKEILTKILVPKST
jgi:hypothetical protein